MTWVLVTHDVADYAAWKRHFDQAADLRRVAGEREFQVLRDEDHGDRVVHFSRWTSGADARAFFESDRIKRIRDEAGVRSPTFHYLQEADHGVL